MCVVAAGLVAAGFAAAGVEEAGVVQVSDGDGEPLQRCHPSAVLCWSTGLVDRVGGARSCTYMIVCSQRVPCAYYIC